MRCGTVFTVIGADQLRAMRCVLNVHGGRGPYDQKESTRRFEQSAAADLMLGRDHAIPSNP